ncbi:unnamed protein product, partial [Mesorhabditis belari]|uniref:Uncharacterized protein n=1 Tax=Mesorhabditis belari TaxID=2138241 RepID=A0AAF3F1K3_9BILA
MLLRAAALLGISVVCTLNAQDCTSHIGTRNVFGQYLQCIKHSLDQDYKGYEEELQEDSKRAVQACFASNIDDGNRHEKCVLTGADLEKPAWDRNGPLRDCTICRTFAAGAIKAIKATPADDQKCIRQEITKAIAREANVCLSKKIANFAGVPDIPDLEEGSFEFKDDVIQSISDHILVHSRLSFCGERKPSRAENSKRCLRSPFAGYLENHCQIIANCDSRLAVGSCATQIPATRNAVCGCIHETREELKQRIASISEVFNELLSGSSRGPVIGSSSKVDVCVAAIKKHMITPVNDWVTVIDSALSTCIRKKPAGQNLGMEALLNVGCRKVIADTTGTASGQLKIGFDFVNNLIDAMVERSARFCGGEHCLQG